MASNVVKELVIKLGYKPDTTGLEKFKKEASDAAKTSAKAFAALGAAVTASVGGLVAFVDRSTAVLDTTAKTARALGFAADEFQRLSFAAQRGGATVSDLQIGFKFLDQQMLAARQGGAQEFTNALGVLGLKVEDLAGKGREAQLGLLGDALQAVGDNSLRTGLQMRLMGESGGKLASVLEGGTEGLRATAEQAERLGIVFSKDALSAAEEFQDQMLDTKLAFQSVALAIASDALPTVRNWVINAREAGIANRELFSSLSTTALSSITSAVNLAAPAFQGLAESAVTVAGAFEGADSEIAKATPALIGLTAAVGIAAGPWAALATALGLVAGNLDLIIEAMQDTALAELLNFSFSSDRKFANRQRTTTIRDSTARLAEGAFLDADQIDADIKRLQGQQGDTSLALRDPQAYLRLKKSIQTSKRLRDIQLADARAKLFELQPDQLRQISEASSSTTARIAANAALEALQEADAELNRVTAELSEAEQIKRLQDQEAQKKAGERKAAAEAAAQRRSIAQARGLFGEQLSALAAREGLGSVAIEQALGAAAGSLRQGATERVARNAALGQLGSLAGVDLIPKYDQDPLLRDILGENVPDVRLSTMALGATPQVLNSEINNYFEFDNDFAINGSGDPNAVARSVAASIRESFEGAVEKSTKLAKVRFNR